MEKLLMKLTIVVLFFSMFVLESNAQPRADREAQLISQTGTLSVMPLYQRWSMDSVAFAEASSIVSLYYPVSREASVSLRGAFGSTSGDISSLGGVADMELSGTYHLESANLVFNLGIGIPSGKKELTADEFGTSLVLANTLFRFQIPHFGEGVRLSPGVLWALPMSEDVVLGFGLTYQYRGRFEPLQNFGKYDPGDEVSATAGFEVRIGDASSLSGDVIYTHYGVDKLNDADFFSAGDKILSVLQYRTFFDLDELLIHGTYRTRAKPDVALGRILTPLKDRLEPALGELFVSYTSEFSKNFSAQFSLEGRFFESTAVPFSGFTLVEVGVQPTFVLADGISLPLRLKYVYGNVTSTSGALSGIEAGVGLVLSY